MLKLSLLLEKFLFWLVFILLIFIPLYPKLPLMGVSGTFVAVRLEDLVIALTFIVWAAAVFTSGKMKLLLRDTLFQSLLLFFFVGAVSLFAAIFLTHTATPNLGLLHLLRRVEYMMLLPVAYTAISNKRQLVLLLVTLSLVLFVVNTYAMGQKYLHWPVISTGNSEFAKGQILYLTPDARVNSTFAGHYDLAVFLAMMISGLTALFFYVRNRFWQLGLVFLGGFSMLVLIMTAARLSFVAAIAGMIVALLLAGKKKLLLAVLILTILILAYPSQLRERFVSTLTVNILDRGQRYTPDDAKLNDRSRLNIPTLPVEVASEEEEASRGAAYSNVTPGEPTNKTQLGVYRSFGIRMDQEWPRAIRAFSKNPLLGTGYSSLGLATDNDFLRSLGEVGILGTAAFLLIILESSKRVWMNLRLADKTLRLVSAGTLSMMVAFILSAALIDVFESSKVASLFWMFVGISLAIKKFR